VTCQVERISNWSRSKEVNVLMLPAEIAVAEFFLKRLLHVVHVLGCLKRPVDVLLKEDILSIRKPLWKIRSLYP